MAWTDRTGKIVNLSITNPTVIALPRALPLSAVEVTFDTEPDNNGYSPSNEDKHHGYEICQLTTEGAHIQ